MTEDELLKIKEHIEIHARREPRAIKITQILWKAVEELESVKELQEENRRAKELLRELIDNLGTFYTDCNDSLLKADAFLADCSAKELGIASDKKE